MEVPAFVLNLDPVTLAIPFFTLSVFAEMLHARMTRKTRFETRDSAASLMMGLGSNVTGILFALLIGGWSVFVYEHRLMDVPFTWWVWILAIVFDDFIYYWVHRFGHTIRWFWADHIIHHSSQHYNLTTALRQSWFSPFTLKFLWLGSVMVFIGFHPAMVAFVGGINLIYQFWVHTEAIKRCPPWFEAVFNTPSHHRVHHATNPMYLDRNYGGIFIIWDRMFGTFQSELDQEACRYGIVKNIATYNPLKIATHEWVSIAKDMAGAKSVKDAALYLLAPPGWSPDGSRETSRQILEKWKARQERAVDTEVEAAE